MQGKQLKRFISLTVLGGSLGWSSYIGAPRFVPIYDPLVIRAQKNSPAFVAFEEINKKKNNQDTQWLAFENRSAIFIGTKVQKSLQFAKNFENKIILDEMIIRKMPEALSLEYSRQRQVVENRLSENQWIENLSERDRIRLREAQYRTDILNEDWHEQGFSEKAKEVLEKSGILVGGSIRVSDNTNSKVYVSATDSSGNITSEPPRPQVGRVVDTTIERSFTANPTEERGRPIRRIVGPLEITGGLAVTNEHHIEIRRNDEGVLHELGRVDLSQGTYNIVIDDASGSVLGRLVDKEGKILGEGSFRLNRVSAQAGNYIQGPRLKIEPHLDFSGVVTNYYNSKPAQGAPANTRVTFVKGISDIAIRKDGIVSMDGVTKGSSTVLRAAAPKYMQTTQIIISGQEFKSFVYPESMIKALQEIVGQQRSIISADTPTIIWGRVAIDKKPVSGIEVSLESDPSLQAIYFNQFMIPDSNLRTTSENGLYAFINVELGFHSLLATRSESFFGYSNVIVEDGSVAQGDIESTIKSESVPLKVYDAFSGEAHPVKLTMQSLSDEVSVEGEVQTLMLPHVSRLGMMQVRPIGSDYIPARYLYNDSDEFIHAPLIQFNWLRSIKASLKINDSATGGVIVGFVHDEDFEVYLAGYDNFDQRNIVFFDMQGRVLQNRKGMSGGGFIIYNVPEDTHEVVVVGTRSQKIYSRLLPVDPNSLSVLSFR